MIAYGNELRKNFTLKMRRGIHFRIFHPALCIYSYLWVCMVVNVIHDLMIQEVIKSCFNHYNFFSQDILD